MANCKYMKLKLNHQIECKATGKIVNWNICKFCKLREFKNINIEPKIKPIGKSSSKRNTITPKIDISSKTRLIVNNRDNHICRLCGKYGVQLHHIYYRSERKDLIDEPNNLISLCFECHQLVHSNKKKYQPMLLDLIQDIKKEGR